MLEVSLAHYLILSSLIFTIGLFGIFLNRKNLIIILMSLELILLSANINFVAFSKFNGMNLDGHIFGLFVIVLAAAEAAVALAIIINIYNNLNSINVDDAAELRQ